MSKKFCKEHHLSEPKVEEMQKGFRMTVYKEQNIREIIDGGVNKFLFFAKQLKDEGKIEFKGTPRIGGYFVK